MLTGHREAAVFLFLRPFHLQTQSQYLVRFDGEGNGMIRHLQFSFFNRIFQKDCLQGYSKLSGRGQSHWCSGIVDLVEADVDAVAVLGLLHSLKNHICLIHT